MSAIIRTDNAPTDLGEVMRLSDMLAKAGGGFIPTHLKNAGQVAAVVLAGAELGIGPMASMRGLTLIQGKVVLDASLIGALMRKAGVRMTWTVSTDTVATLHCERDGLTHDETFTIEDAKRAGLTGKDNWRNWPKSMLRARATSQAARAFCPEVFYGAIYVADELEGILPKPEAGSKPTLASITAKHAEPVEVAGTPVADSGPTADEMLTTDRMAELDGVTDADGVREWCERRGPWYLGLATDSEDRKAVNKALASAAKRLGVAKDDIAGWIQRSAQPVTAEVVNG